MKDRIHFQPPLEAEMFPELRTDSIDVIAGTTPVRIHAPIIEIETSALFGGIIYKTEVHVLDEPRVGSREQEPMERPVLYLTNGEQTLPTVVPRSTDPAAQGLVHIELYSRIMTTFEKNNPRKE